MKDYNVNLSLALLDVVKYFHFYFFYITVQSQKDSWNKHRFLESYNKYHEILEKLKKLDCDKYEIRNTFLEYGLTEEKVEIMKDCVERGELEHLLLKETATGKEHEHIKILDIMLNFILAFSHENSGNRKYRLKALKDVIEVVENWHLYTEFLYVKKFPLGVYPLQVRYMFNCDYLMRDFEPRFDYSY